jgi:hypothetical protein
VISAEYFSHDSTIVFVTTKTPKEPLLDQDHIRKQRARPEVFVRLSVIYQTLSGNQYLNSSVDNLGMEGFRVQRNLPA